jgi:hypothetical protein
MFQRNVLGISAQISLPKAEEKYQNISVGDEILAQHVHAMKPYSKQFLTDVYRMFNYRLPRVRSVVEK